MRKKFSDNLLKHNPIAYVAGYFLHKCFLSHDCSSCKAAMVTDKIDDNRNLLRFFRAYEPEKCFGGLLASATPYLQYIGRTILSKLQSIPVPFIHCTEFPLKYLLKLFLQMQIYYTIKFAN